MTPERLRALLDTFGADPRRWPAAERDAARALLDSGPTGWVDARADAALLDRELDVHAIAAPDAALVDRIAAAAASSARQRRTRTGWLALPLWPRAGWALTGLAGAVAGAVLVSVVLVDSSPAAATDWQQRGTAFSDRTADWSEE